MLQRARDLARLKRIVRRARQREVLQHRSGKLGNVVDEGLVVQREGVGGGGGAHAVLVADLDAVEGRVAVDDGVALCAADARGGLEAVGDGAAEARVQDLAVGELDEAPGVVGVAEARELAVDGLLAEGYYAVDLLGGVGDVLFDVEEVSAGIDLRQVSLRLC